MINRLKIRCFFSITLCITAILLMNGCSSIEKKQTITGNWESIEFVGDKDWDASQNKVFLSIDSRGLVSIETQVKSERELIISHSEAQIEGNYIMVNEKRNKIIVLDGAGQLKLVDEKKGQSIIMQRRKATWANSSAR